MSRATILTHDERIELENRYDGPIPPHAVDSVVAQRPRLVGVLAREVAIKTATAAIAERDRRIQLHTEKAAIAATCLADARTGRPGNIMIDGFSQQLASHNAAIEICRAEKAEFERQLSELVGDKQAAE